MSPAVCPELLRCGLYATARSDCTKGNTAEDSVRQTDSGRRVNNPSAVIMSLMGRYRHFEFHRYT